MADNAACPLLTMPYGQDKTIRLLIDKLKTTQTLERTLVKEKKGTTEFLSLLTDKIIELLKTDFFRVFKGRCR